MLSGVPTSFSHYDYPMVRPLVDSPWSVSLAHPDDIAAMKISALAGRGSRKVFVDLYAYAREVAPLDQAFERFREKYRGVTVDPYHLLRSLTLFEDAEAEAMPEVLGDISWDRVKAFFRAAAARLYRDLP